MSKKTLIALTIILVIVNVYIITYFSIEERRVARLCSSIFYTLLFLAFKGFSNSKIILGVLLTFVIADVFGLYYENSLISKLIYIVRIAGCFLLMAAVFKRFKVKKVKPLVFIVFAVVIILNLYLLFTLVESATKSTNGILQYLVIILYGITVVLLAFMASNYNFRYNSSKSAYFFYAVLAFVFSDLSWFCSYYLNYTVLYNADVIFYLVGLFSIISYSIETEESKDVLFTE